MRNQFGLLEDLKEILFGVLVRDLYILDYMRLLHVGLRQVKSPEGSF